VVSPPDLDEECTMIVTRLRRSGTMLLFAIAVFWPAAIAAQKHFPTDEDLRVMLRYLVEDGETQGIVVGMLEADGSTRVVGYGNPGPGAEPLGPRSVFEIGSITKTFTGTILADMVARGEVALDDPVSMYLPDEVTVPSFGDREITLLDLATHTSGIEEQKAIQLLAQLGLTPRDPQNPWASYTVDALYTWLADLELGREPGAEYEYSNLGMGLLGYALARAAGMTPRELVHERVTGPLGMDMTGYALEGGLERWMVRGHGADGVVPYWFATGAAEGAGGLRSNAEDMLAFLAANVGPPDPGLEVAMRAAHEPQRPMGGEESGVGLAWRSYTLNGRPLVWHGGATGGFRAVIVFDPERRVGAVVLTNSAGYQDNLGTDLVVHDPPPAIQEIGVDPNDLTPYTGEYRAANGRSIYIGVDDDGFLTAQVPNEVRVRLYAEADSSFFAKREEWHVTFHGDADGGGAELALRVRGIEVPRFQKTDDEAPLPAVLAGNTRLSDADIARYEGTYDLRIGGQTLEYRVFGEDGRLMSRLGRTQSQLIPVGDHEFLVAVNAAIRVVFSLESGRAEQVTLHQGPRSDTGARRR
jgi:CubicO group peptidase (beta-lactamase class C family)